MPRTKATSKSRYVKVNESRGFGDGIFYVKGYKGKGPSEEFTLDPMNGGECFNIYVAHCYVDLECIRKTKS